MIERCANCDKPMDKVFPGHLCKDCHRKFVPGRRELQRKWESLGKPPMDRMIDSSREDAITK